jgi:hypothetical protein
VSSETIREFFGERHAGSRLRGSQARGRRAHEYRPTRRSGKTWALEDESDRGNQGRAHLGRQSAMNRRTNPFRPWSLCRYCQLGFLLECGAARHNQLRPGLSQVCVAVVEARESLTCRILGVAGDR